jgi:hypothetical protein
MTHLPGGGRVRRQQRYGRCGLFKPFHGESSLLHSFQKAGIGIFLDNTAKLCPVVAHNARAVNDHIVHEPIAGMVLQPEI